MGSKNQSPSYLASRERPRNFLLNTPDGKEATRILKEHATPAEMTRIFDDDTFTNWDDIVEEHRGSTVLAASCREARGAFELAAGSRSNKLPPPAGQSKMRRIAQIPAWYMLKRPIEMGDPEYWNSKVNTYRELLANPQWSCVPESYLRGQLEEHLPKGKKIAVPE